ncbi:MAG: RNA polymerase factor sigma-54 [Burkholderiaceae bacterium]
MLLELSLRSTLNKGDVVAQLIYEMRAKQQTTLTPRLQQSVKLLQMSTLDFSREVAEAISNNPFLEDDEGSSTEEDQTGAKELHAATPEEIAAPAQTAVSEEVDPPVTTEYDAAADASTSYSGDYPTSRNNDQPETDIGQWARSETSLQESLRRDLCSYQLGTRDRCIVELIIEALDENGYLRIPMDELIQEGQLDPMPTHGEWEMALSLVQHLGAPGIGARDLQECLALQLKALSADTPCRDLALRIVQDAIERLGRCDYTGLARVLSTTEADINQACLLIRSLEPRPGSHFSRVDPSCYIVPDVLVRKIGANWVAIPNDGATPRARLNTAYTQLFRQTRYDDRPLMAQALQEARWLMRSLEQRNTTIARVAQAIVDRQQTFFDYGDVALRPMMLSEIAEELGMHESTVSRATSNKYLASPRGIFEFKYFFSRELATQSGGTCSAVAVRALIQEMIEAENPSEPLSDVLLAERLASEGVRVARRTVSKYRAQIKYPPAEQRRRPVMAA